MRSRYSFAVGGADRAITALKRGSSSQYDQDITIPNSTTNARGNFMVSTVVCGHLVAALRERVLQFNGAEHKYVISRKVGRQLKSTGQ
jgi:hypothetical protein